MKMIDIIEVKNEIKKGNLSVFVNNGYVLLMDNRSGECVSLIQLTGCDDEEWKNVEKEVKV